MIIVSLGFIDSTSVKESYKVHILLWFIQGNICIYKAFVVTNMYKSCTVHRRCTRNSYAQFASTNIAHPVADPGGFHWFLRKPLSKVKIILIPIFMQQLKAYLKTYFVLLHNHS